MSKHLLPILWSLVFGLWSLSPASIIRVPQDQPSIQAGINAAINGDTVLVADSTYYENINFMGKAITVTSYFLMDGDSVHIDSTIINGSQPSHPDSGSVVFFISGEDTTSVVYGFTITGGTGTISVDSRVGGGVYCYLSGARVSHNKIIFNTVNHTNKCDGGGIGYWPRNDNAGARYVIIEDNIIESNSITSSNATISIQGGGIHIVKGRILGNVIRFNSVSGQPIFAGGGGIAAGCEDTATRTLVVISGNTITHNQAMTPGNSGAYGGGIDVVFCNVQILENVITNNQTEGSHSFGAGVRLWRSKEISIVENNIISFNSSTGSTDSYGGGMYYSQTTGITIQDNYFEGNWSFLGGGIWSYSGMGNHIYGNDFINNQARSGGGIFIYDSDDTLSANRIYGNHASLYNGGGIYIYDCSPMVLNNIITGNKSGLNGGGIYIAGVSNAAQIINNTIVVDTAGLNGGGLCITSDSVIVMNTILWDNSATNGVQIFSSGVNTPVVFCDVQGGWPGEGNISKEPMLRGNYFVLSDSSSCIGAGTLSYQFGSLIFNCPPTCLLGRARPFPSGTNPDMGACESLRGFPLVGLEKQSSNNLPHSFELKQNYPNPFNPTTVISWQLAVGSQVKLTVYALNGQKVATLVDEKQPAGTHSVEWDASGLASGVYFYQLEAKKFKQVRKMLLAR